MNERQVGTALHSIPAPGASPTHLHCTTAHITKAHSKCLLPLRLSLISAFLALRINMGSEPAERSTTLSTLSSSEAALQALLRPKRLFARGLIRCYWKRAPGSEAMPKMQPWMQSPPAH